MIDTKAVEVVLDRIQDACLLDDSQPYLNFLDYRMLWNNGRKLLAVHDAARALLDAGTQAEFNAAHDKLREVMQ